MTEVVTDDAIAQLTAVLGTDLPAQTLKVLLVRSGGDVSSAVQSYFDNPGADFSNESVFQPPAPAAAVGDDVLGTLFKTLEDQGKKIAGAPRPAPKPRVCRLRRLQPAFGGHARR